VRLQARGAQQPRRRRRRRPRARARGRRHYLLVQHGAGHVQRRHLCVPAAPRQAHRLLHHRRRLRRQRLLHRAAPGSHPSDPLAEIKQSPRRLSWLS